MKFYSVILSLTILQNEQNNCLIYSFPNPLERSKWEETTPVDFFLKMDWCTPSFLEAISASSNDSRSFSTVYSTVVTNNDMQKLEKTR